MNTKAYKVVTELSSTSGRIEKESILHEAWKQNLFEFFHGAKLAYDKTVTFGVKKLPIHNGTSSASDCDSWNRFENELVIPLRSRTLTGNAAAKAIDEFMKSVSPDEWNHFYSLVLSKDLNCGISEKTINKVLEEIRNTTKDTRVNDYIIPVFSCQLAHPGEKFPKKLTGKKYVDVKLDGVRILAVLDIIHKSVTLHTRNGKINTNFRDIENLLLKIIPMLTESVVLDGEMISLSFQDLMKQFQRKDEVDTKDAKYAVFDVIPLKEFLSGKSNSPQHSRDALAQSLVAAINDERVYHIPKQIIDLNTENGKKEFERYNRFAIDSGFEGIMVKDIDAPYECKRSHAWLKMKPTITVDLTIIGVETGEPGTKYEHCLGKIICEGKDEETEKFIHVSVGSGITDDEREKWWRFKDKVIGRRVEILADTISQNQDGTHSLRFPRFVRFRDDK
jgi:DNA ligase 1